MDLHTNTHTRTVTVDVLHFRVLKGPNFYIKKILQFVCNYEFWGYYGAVIENSALLGCDAASLGKCRINLKG